MATVPAALGAAGLLNDMNEQPGDLRDFLTEAEALVMDWYSRDGVEGPHGANLEMIATLLGLDVVMNLDWPFATLRDRASLFLVAAFQMGRAAAYGDDGSTAE